MKVLGLVGRTFGFSGLPLTLLLPRYYAFTFHFEMRPLA